MLEWEQMILEGIQGLRQDWLDTAMVFVSRLGDMGMIWIVLAAALLAAGKYRRAGAALSCGLLLDLICCNLLLKPLVGRERPFVFRPDMTLLTAPPGGASFPSGHTAASFAAVFALRGAGSPLWRPALVLASAIGFSRLYLYVHWPTDVLGGVIVGALAGWAGAWTVRRVCKEPKAPL